MINTLVKVYLDELKWEKHLGLWDVVTQNIVKLPDLLKVSVIVSVLRYRLPKTLYSKCKNLHNENYLLCIE